MPLFELVPLSALSVMSIGQAPSPSNHCPVRGAPQPHRYAARMEPAVRRQPKGQQRWPSAFARRLVLGRVITLTMHTPHHEGKGVVSL